MSIKQSPNFRNISLVDFIGLIFLVVFSMAILPWFSQPLKSPPKSEAKQYVALINKGQQFYYSKNGKFSDNISNLGLGIKLETSNYSYKIKELNSLRVIVTATTKNKDSFYYYKPIRLPFFGIGLPFSQRIPLPSSKSYSGIVYIKDGTPQSMICKTDEPSLIAPDNFQSFDQCPNGSSAL